MPSLRHIARLAGVSATTVSLALRDHPRISDATRARIKEIANAVQYHPVHSSNLTTHDTTIGYLIHNWFGIVATDMLRGAMEEATRRGISVMVRQVNQHAGWIEEALYAFARTGVSGIILGHSYTKPLARHILYHLQSRGIYTVQIMNRLFNNKIDSICRHEDLYAHTVAQGIMQYGHQSVYGLHLNAVDVWTDVFAHHGIELSYYFQPDGAIGINHAFAHYLQLEPRPTVFITGTDEDAYRIYSLAREHGLRVPGQLSVVGMGNIFGDYLYPEITTLDIKAREMGRIASNRLIDRMEAGIPPGEISDHAEIALEPTLINRGSLGDFSP